MIDFYNEWNIFYILEDVISITFIERTNTWNSLHSILQRIPTCACTHKIGCIPSIPPICKMWSSRTTDEFHFRKIVDWNFQLFPLSEVKLIKKETYDVATETKKRQYYFICSYICDRHNTIYIYTLSPKTRMILHFIS